MIKFRKKIMAVLILAALVSGCSATSALTGLIGSKPDITAQAGQENVKQTVGVTAKSDSSTEQDTSIKGSSVGAVDTSSRKKVSASSIQAQTITADKIEIRNSDSGWITAAVAVAAIFSVIFIPLLFGWLAKRKKAQ